jgi:hypothetical protein
MARSHLIKQGDVTRALKAARAVGIKVGSYEVDQSSGKIIVHAAEDALATESPYDRWKSSGRGQG